MKLYKHRIVDYVLERKLKGMGADICHRGHACMEPKFTFQDRYPYLLPDTSSTLPLQLLPWVLASRISSTTLINLACCLRRCV